MALPKTKLKTPTHSVEDGDIDLPTPEAKSKPVARNTHTPLNMTLDELVAANILTQAQANNNSYPHPVEFASVNPKTITREILTEKGWVVPNKSIAE